MKNPNLAPGASNLAFDHDLDSTILAGLGGFEGLHSLLQLEPGEKFYFLYNYSLIDIDFCRDDL